MELWSEKRGVPSMEGGGQQGVVNMFFGVGWCRL